MTLSVPPTIYFAGGGTGGHIYPGLAIAEQLEWSNAHFICADRAIDRQILEPTGYPFTPISMSGVPRNPLKLPRFLHRFKRCQAQCRDVLSDDRAGCVVAMGGYVAGPAVYAARQLKLPVLLVNLDARAGRANRRLAPRCDRVFSVYDAPGLGSTYEKIGYPVRRAALKPASERGRPSDLSAEAAAKAEDRDRTWQPHLLITGASQGAQTLNEAAIELFRRGAFDRWQVTHLTGRGNYEQIARQYADAGGVEVIDFTEAMGEQWGRADLAISRAGAGSVGEAVANHVPTIFLPYPYHADEHQRHNAQPYADAGGAIVLTDTKVAATNADQLQPLLADFLARPNQLAAMRRVLEGLARTDGAAALAHAADDAAGALP